MQAHEIANALGGRRSGRGWVACCPAHDDHNPSLSISSATGDKTLVYCHAGCEQAAVIDALRRIGLWDEEEARQYSDPGRRIAKTKHAPDRDGTTRVALVRAIWAASIPAAGTPAGAYLRSRGLHLPPPASLRFLPATGSYPPAMVAAFSMAQEPEPGVLSVLPDAIRAIHLTRLTHDGRGKAQLANPKVILGHGAKGVPIALAPPNDLLGLAITEGIEDALSVHAATGLGAWAAGAAPRMAALAKAVPGYVDCVTIYADDDKAGITGATALLRRLTGRGIFARIKVLNSGVVTAHG